MKNTVFSFTIALVLGSIFAAPTVFAKGKPAAETAQSLSVPTIVVGDSLGNLACGPSPDSPSDLMPPIGIPKTGYEEPGYYWVQKTHAWQAQCFQDDQAIVFGSWGDNLKGDASLKVGSPIRVELVLMNMFNFSDTIATLQGYSVIKLQPSLLDRLSAYGHTAIDDNGSWIAAPIDFAPAQWLVHDPGITFSVLNKDTGIYAVQPGTSPTAEINATGKVVYGYNLRLESAGSYRIQFTSGENVQFTGQDAPAGQGGMYEDDSHNVYIDIEVVPGAGGGGSGGRGNGGGRK